MLNKNKIGAIILSGGKSSRMGTDKAWLNLQGKPMIQHVLNEINEVTEEVVIIANDEKYKALPYPVFRDLVPNKGPLSGIVTGLHYALCELNWVLSCDVPFLSKEVLFFLAENSGQYAVTIAKWGDKIHPLIGCYRKDALPLLSKELESNQLKIRVALSKMDVNYLDCSQFDASEFSNINSPEDLKKAL